MTVDPQAAYEFIQRYKRLLFHLSERSDGKQPEDGLNRLADGREFLVTNPGEAYAKLDELSEPDSEIQSEVVAAIRSLEVEHWVYLRDTKRYSIFVHPENTAAYGVVGLTDPVRNITGGAGIGVRTGVMRYRGRYVCDGLLSGLVSLGKNYRKSFADSYRNLKARGKFFVTFE